MRKSAANVFVLGLVSLAASSCAAILGLDQFSEGKGTGGAGGAGGSGGTGGGPDLCGDGKKDGTETGKDCGGPCSPCADGEGCAVGPDCASKICATGTCIALSCTDKVKNGSELDVDCGGACPKCGPGQICGGDGDCKSGKCTAGACASTCADTVKGGAETDVDCGGGMVSGCPGCGDAKSCNISADCKSGVCKIGVCVEPFVWGKRFPAASGYIALDGAENAVLAGSLLGDTDLGGGVLSTPSGTSSVLLAKFDDTGKLLWSGKFGDGQKGQYAAGVSVDKAGNGLIIGTFDGTLDFTFGAGGSMTALGGGDLFIAKHDPLGKHLWSKRFGDATAQSGVAIGTDATGNVYVAGNFQGQIDFGKGVLTSAGGDDVFVAKLDPSGATLWSKRFGDVGDDHVGALAIDKSNNLVIVGGFQGTIDFGKGMLVSAGMDDVFVAKLDTTGVAQWSERYGNSKGNAACDVAFNAAGEVVVGISSYDGSLDLGGGPIASGSSGGIFLAKYSGGGAHLWSKGFDANPSYCRTGIGANDEIVFSGNFSGSLDLGGGPLTGLSQSTYSMFLSKFDSGGKFVWNQAYGNGGDAFTGPFAYAFATYASGETLISGSLEEGADFGGPLASPLTTISAVNGFLVKLNLP